MRFTEFLAEVMIDVDDETAQNPAAVAAQARQVAQKAQRNPQAVNRDARMAARAERQAAQASEAPTAQLDMKIAKAKEQLATLMQQRQRLSR